MKITDLVCPRGVEPLASSSASLRSIQLSYGHMLDRISHSQLEKSTAACPVPEQGYWYRELRARVILQIQCQEIYIITILSLCQY